jgi:hypothetical protein
MLGIEPRLGTVIARIIGRDAGGEITRASSNPRQGGIR